MDFTGKKVVHKTWGEGTVIVENGATLKSNTELFWGGASAEQRYVDNDESQYA